MQRTRTSLYYVVGYLSVGGIGLALAPDLALRLLFATGSYGDVMARVVGILMIGLAIVVVQIIRHDVRQLFPTTLGLRLFLCACFIALYVYSSDRLFLVLTGIVGLGVVMTGTAYWRERSAVSREQGTAAR